MEDQERPLWNPYVGGVVLGLVLLASFLILGFGLGSSGAVNRSGIWFMHMLTPEAVEANGYFSNYVGQSKHILDDWLVFEVIGVFLGGAIGAYSSGRMRRGNIESGPNISVKNRLIIAVIGGILMGVGARIARGCTSGQALTGGALLSTGSWVFMICVFAGGYMLAPIVRRQWR